MLRRHCINIWDHAMLDHNHSIYVLEPELHLLHRMAVLYMLMVLYIYIYMTVNSKLRSLLSCWLVPSQWGSRGVGAWAESYHALWHFHKVAKIGEVVLSPTWRLLSCKYFKDVFVILRQERSFGTWYHFFLLLLPSYIFQPHLHVYLKL